MKSKVLLKIKGHYITRFIKRLNRNNIDILRIYNQKENEMTILIYSKDYEKVNKIKSIYKIQLLNTYGPLKLKKIIKINKYLIIFILIGYIIFTYLTSLVFNIQIVHTNKSLRQLIKQDLEENNITKYSFKKNYKQLSKIKERIINKHPDKIEWLEIKPVGTKYIVRVEERKITTPSNHSKPRNIIAKKNGIIKKIIAEKGQPILEPESYVKKGDIIIDGEVKLNEKTMNKVKAQGKIYAEVWYIVKTSYPFIYHEIKETGRKQNIYKISFLNKNIELTLNKYKHKKTNETVMLKHNLLPIKLIYDKQKEINIISQIMSFEEAQIMAEKKAYQKISKTLDTNEHIIKAKHLKSFVNNSTIDVEMFFSVYENITDYQEIE